MTKEQAIEFLKEYTETNFSERCRDAHNMAIKALEQRPSEDCVSRAEMLKYQQYLRGKMSNEENHKLWEFIKDLPPVTPTFPKGATNGDMIKAMFPNQTIGCAIPITDRNGAKFYRTTINGVTDFTEDWWNALYKRGNENGKVC